MGGYVGLYKVCNLDIYIKSSNQVHVLYIEFIMSVFGQYEYPSMTNKKQPNLKQKLNLTFYLTSLKLLEIIQ